jgi:hypothetical protein
MLLIEEFRPKKWNELIGNKYTIEKLKKYLPKHNILLFGDPGLGKTSVINVWANENNYKIIEINASDTRDLQTWKNLARQTKTNMPTKVIFLLDEADGIQWFRHYKIIFDILKKTIHPIALICNDKIKIRKFKDIWEKSQSKKEGSKKPIFIELGFYPVKSKSDIVVRLKQIEKILQETNPDIKFNYSKIPHNKDIRNSLNAVLYLSDGYENKKDDFQIITNFLQRNVVEDIDLDKHAIWISENIPYFYSGYDVIRCYRILTLAIESNNVNPLKLFPRVNVPRNTLQYPNILRRITEKQRKEKYQPDDQEKFIPKEKKILIKKRKV